MRKITGPLLFCLVLLPAAVATQEHHEHGKHHSPYAEQESSGIAALSQDELNSLLEGAGMGLARAAELNHYPGPLHVLELAAELQLSEEQHTETKRVRGEMLDEARRLGAEIVENERMLNRRFDHRHIDEEVLRQLTAEIAGLQGELRFTHLLAHLRLATILTHAQIEAYDSLRGYAP